MSFNAHTVSRVRDYLANFQQLLIEEKKMFGGLAFMINGKMCINVSGDNLMCRFDPVRTEELSLRSGFQKMVMKGREYKGYCYVNPDGFEHDEELKFWVDLCLDFNERAKSSKK